MATTPMSENAEATPDAGSDVVRSQEQYRVTFNCGHQHGPYNKWQSPWVGAVLWCRTCKAVRAVRASAATPKGGDERWQ